MGYEKKTWKNRQSEYPNRRTLTPVDGQENTYDVARAEGLVMEEGDAFDQQAMNDLEERIESGLVDSGVNVYTHTKSGTVHEFTGQGANGRAKMTANVSEGDTFTVNGTPVTAYVGVDEATGSMAGSEYTGRWVTFVYDREANTLNFKGGGGKVTVSGLSAEVVKKGTAVTVKQGAKTVQSVIGSYTPAFRTQEVSQTQYISDYEWKNYAIPVPKGTVGIVKITDDGWGSRVNGISGTTLNVALWSGSTSKNYKVTATVLIARDLE